MPKYTVTTLDNIGCLVTATPSAPSREVCKLPLGSEVSCTGIMTFNRVPYARVINPDGWIRVNESDGRTPHLEVIENDNTSDLIAVLTRIAIALEKK